MFKTKDVIAVSCAAHRFNSGFLSKDSIRFDKKAEGKRANSDLLYAHFLDPKELKFKNALPKLKVIKEDIKMAEDKKYKPHMMYDKKTGKGQMAFTKKKHLALKAKGHTHTKPKAKKKK